VSKGKENQNSSSLKTELKKRPNSAPHPVKDVRGD
jgi:hypothetical protein